MTLENIDSQGRPIRSQTAVRLYGLWMRTIGFLDQWEIDDHTVVFKRAMNDHGQRLKCDVAEEKRKLLELESHLKRDIAELKQAKKSAKSEDSKRQILEEIESIESEIQEHLEDITDLVEAQKRYENFKSDKRDFLVQYVNWEVHNHCYPE